MPRDTPIQNTLKNLKFNTGVIQFGGIAFNTVSPLLHDCVV